MEKYDKDGSRFPTADWIGTSATPSGPAPFPARIRRHWVTNGGIVRILKLKVD